MTLLPLLPSLTRPLHQFSRFGEASVICMAISIFLPLSPHNKFMHVAYTVRTALAQPHSIIGKRIWIDVAAAAVCASFNWCATSGASSEFR